MPSPAMRVSVSSPSHVHGRRASNGSVTVAAERKATVEHDNKRRGEKFEIPFESSYTAHVSPAPSPSNGSAYRQQNPARRAPTVASPTTVSDEQGRKRLGESKGDESPRAVLQEMKMKKLRELEQKSHVRTNLSYQPLYIIHYTYTYLSSTHRTA